MKTRQGFVSNSSSSSFVCDVSGEGYEGWDGDYGDIRQACCANGHSFSSEYMLAEGSQLSTADKRSYMLEHGDNDRDTVAFKAATEGQIEQWWLDEWEEDYEDDLDYFDLSEAKCPICQFQKACDRDIMAYLLKHTATSREEMLTNLRREFSSYRDFLASIGK